MTLLSAHGLEKEYEDRTLFSGVAFEINEREKIGLVGDNGCGKTTLFRMLMGETDVTHGEIAFSRECRIGYMEQHAFWGQDVRLWDAVEQVFAPLIAMEKRLEQLTTWLDAGITDPQFLEEQQQLRERWEAGGGLTRASRQRAVLLGLGFDEAAWEQPISTLSGGQRSKAAMARLLLSDSNLLLLDEPTNHLDIASVEWLEDFLRGYAGAVLVISHDRYFLDRVTTRTFELFRGKMYCTDGNYSVHHEKRQKDKEVAEKHYRTAARQIRRMEESIERFRRFNREKSIRAAESKQKALDRFIRTVEEPEGENRTLKFDFSVMQSGGNEVLWAEGLAKAFDRPLFHGVDLKLMRGQRVFLVGANGCGKTTLLNILCGRLTPDNGFVRLGAKVSVGYYDQVQATLDGSKTALEELWDAFPKMQPNEVRSALAAFLFRGDEVFRPIEQMSGGERARLLLLKLMLARDNLLLLDEPTNHLDIASREALEQALLSYDGTMLVVSHDRYFINRLADKVIALSDEGCKSYDGNYDNYLARTSAQASTEEKPVREPKVNDYKLRKEQESYRRRLLGKLRRTEQEIADLEERSAALQREMETVAEDYGKLMELTRELDGVTALLEEKMTAWTDLQSEAESWESGDE